MASRRRFMSTIFLSVIIGCGSGAEYPKTYPVKGTVLYGDKPPVGALVRLEPTNATPSSTVRPHAKVGADGTFQVTSFHRHDGAVPGEYAVTICWMGEGGGPGPDLFSGRFNDPKKPVLVVTIREGENIIPTIKLTGPAVTPKAGSKSNL